MESVFQILGVDDDFNDSFLTWGGGRGKQANKQTDKNKKNSGERIVLVKSNEG